MLQSFRTPSPATATVPRPKRWLSRSSVALSRSDFSRRAGSSKSVACRCAFGADWILLGPAPLDEALSEYLAACRAAGGAMPGIASTEELNALRAQQGEAADGLFLEMMIRHHAGGLQMADFASRFAETPQVRALATSMRLEQDREIHYLRGLLSSRFSARS